jgi:hypothetical protein
MASFNASRVPCRRRTTVAIRNPAAVASFVTSSKSARTRAPPGTGSTERTVTCGEVKRTVSESIVACFAGTYVSSTVPEPSARSSPSTVKHPARRGARAASAARRRCAMTTALGTGPAAKSQGVAGPVVVVGRALLG